MKLAARVHKSKDNRLILVAVDLETGKQPGMSVALKEQGFKDGDMIEFRRIRQANPDPKPAPRPKGKRAKHLAQVAAEHAALGSMEEADAKQQVEA